MEEENNRIDKVIEDSPINNPDITFCEDTTYLELLLQNAKDEDEVEKIKETINDYLDITDPLDSEEEKEDNEDN